MSLRFRALNGLWLAGQRAGHRAFRAALGLPARVQAARLHATLERNAGSEYGRRYGFARIRTFREYQDAVPIVSGRASDVSAVSSEVSVLLFRSKTVVSTI